MSYITDTATWETGVYKIDTTDQVLGGVETSKANIPHLHLNRRIIYLYDAIIADGNDLSIPTDIKFTSDNESNMLYMDASQDNIGIGGAPSAGLADLQVTRNSQTYNLYLKDLSTGGKLGVGVISGQGNDWQIGANGASGEFIIESNSILCQVINQTGKTTFNYSKSVAADFNVRGQTDSNLFYVDASQDNIGIGGTPSAGLATLQVIPATAQTYNLYLSNSSAGGKLGIEAPSGNDWVISTDITNNFQIRRDNNVNHITISQTGKTTINYAQMSGGDTNIKGENEINLFYVDASQDNIGIGGTPNTKYKLDITSAITTTNGGSLYAKSTDATAIVNAIHGENLSTSGAGVKGTSSNYGIWGLITSSGNYAVYGDAGSKIGGIALYGEALNGSGTNYGAKGKVGSATSYGGYFENTNATGYAVWGETGKNGGQLDWVATSSKFMKTQLSEANILSSIKESNLKVYNWIYNDSNSDLFEEHIGAMLEDVNNTFGLNFERGLPSALQGGIALGGVIELMNLIDKLENRIKELEEKII